MEFKVQITRGDLVSLIQRGSHSINDLPDEACIRDANGNVLVDDSDVVASVFWTVEE